MSGKTVEMSGVSGSPKAVSSDRNTNGGGSCDAAAGHGVAGKSFSGEGGGDGGASGGSSRRKLAGGTVVG